MLHSIKPQSNDFNLLYLSDVEKLISSIQCSYFNTLTHKIEKGILHLGTRSIEIQPSNISIPLLQMKFAEMQVYKSYTIEELIFLLSKSQQDITSSKDTQNSGFLFKGKNKKATTNQTNQASSKYQNLITVYGSNTNANQQQDTTSVHKSASAKRSYIGQNNSSQSKNINKKLNDSNSDGKEQTTSQANISFNMGLGNTSDALNKILIDKEKETTKATHQGLHFVNTLSHSENKSKPSLVSNDILLFLNDNGFNILLLYDLIKGMKEHYSNSAIRLNFILTTVNKSSLINRTNPSMYEVCITPKTFFIVIEGDSNQIGAFNEDRKYIAESLNKALFDDTKELNYIVNKKVTELLENIMHSSFKGEIVKQFKANRVLPEGIQNGILLIKMIDEKTYIEFHPAVNNYKNKSMRILLSRVEAIVPYRYIFKLNGINILIYQSQRSKVFTFETEDEAKEFGNYLTDHCPNIDSTFNNLEYQTELWSKGLLTNFDYLMYLNIKASRTFNDPSQYPVFPWVIAKYDDDIDDFDISDEKNYRDLNKPMGALNPVKLAKFTEKYLNDKTNYASHEPLYLYPIHYSSPLIIIFYLNRKLPRLQLQMQGGSFDSRMLLSIRSLWDYLYTEGNDVMELIPEFFDSDGEFLINIYNTQYGRLKNSKMVNDVILPKWAKNHKDFIRINRSALESEYVSNNLHNWIDLIFGYKQRGEMAEMHDNLFRPNSYDDYNYNDFTDVKRNAEITNILNSGQTPLQLFRGPHPKKKNIDILNYELQLNPQEVIFQKYKQDNEKLENDHKAKLHSKYEEKLGIIKDNKELEMKRSEKVEKLKE